jgi:hypothetical protein
MPPGFSGLADAGAGFYIVVAFAVLIAGYFFLFWERRKDDSPLKGDDQIGLKLGLFTLLIVALSYAAGGLHSVLWYLLSGTKAPMGSGLIKAGIASLLAGGIGFAAISFLFLPRTNAKEFDRVERYAVGGVAIASGMMAFGALDGLLGGLFNSADWKAHTSEQFASLVVFGALFFLTLMRFGQLSGWTAPQRPVMPMQQPPGGGYPPQGGGGYPPQGGGGYQPQGGGYPPQGGGGYPPQGGGGGYPPQGGGGGFPPQGGGGYPPQGGGGGLPPPGGSGGGYNPGGGGGYQPR